MAGAILAVGALLMATGSSIPAGSHSTPQGMSTTATLTGFRPVLFPAPIWTVLELVGYSGRHGARLPAVDSSGTGRTSPPSWRGRPGNGAHGDQHLHLAQRSRAALVRAVRPAPIFDRYVWPLVFATAMLLAAKALAAEALAAEASGASVATPGTPALATMYRWAAGGATVLLALVAGALATTVTLNADSYDVLVGQRARWRSRPVPEPTPSMPASTGSGAMPRRQRSGPSGGWRPLVRDVVRPAVPRVQGLRLRVRFATRPPWHIPYRDRALQGAGVRRSRAPLYLCCEVLYG